MSAYELHLVALDDKESASPFADESDGRRAWLAAIAGGAHRYAGLVRPSGEHLTRMRCEYSRNRYGSSYSYTDRTDAHVEALRALCGELSAYAPIGYRVGVEPRMGVDTIVFRGSPTGQHMLQIIATDEARLRAHWQGYLPTTGGAS